MGVDLGTEARCYTVGKDADPDEVKSALSRQHPSLLVQTVKADTASNEFFIEMLCAQTLRAAATHALLARKQEIDLLLRLALTTQISAAIAKTGAKKGRPFLLITAGKSGSMKTLSEPAGWKRLSRAELSKGELQRVERAALLNALRG